MTKQEKYIYMAGFFDGEGCVGLNKCNDRKQFSFRTTVQVTQVDERPLLLFKEIFGGNIYLQKRHIKNPSLQDCHLWSIADKKAENCLRALLPYLIVKREKAKLAIKSRSLPKLSNICNIKQVKQETKDKIIKINNKIIKERKKVYAEFKGFLS